MNRLLGICVLAVMVVFIMLSNTMAMGTGLINATFPLPSQYMDENKITLGFCDKNTLLSSKRNIHNGIDISVPANEPVFSLCTGGVVYDNTSAGYWDSFLIIKHNCNGQILYAYYGHVHSSVSKPNDIRAGEKIATIRHDTSGAIGDHLHLSISTGKDWDRYGWGYDLSCEDAIADEYKNPLTYLNFTAGTSPSPPENLRIEY
jgi:murein DD-endopeptidase MepM/ murein hydrolase activator NlpD